MNNSKKAIIIAAAVLGIIYLALIPAAANGYGYMGYRGYGYGPSFWYWGGPSIYHGRNVRNGSTSGSNVRGGGPGSGK